MSGPRIVDDGVRGLLRILQRRERADRGREEIVPGQIAFAHDHLRHLENILGVAVAHLRPGEDGLVRMPQQLMGDALVLDGRVVQFMRVHRTLAHDAGDGAGLTQLVEIHGVVERAQPPRAVPLLHEDRPVILHDQHAVLSVPDQQALVAVARLPEETRRTLRQGVIHLRRGKADAFSIHPRPVRFQYAAGLFRMEKDALAFQHLQRQRMHTLQLLFRQDPEFPVEIRHGSTPPEC